ASETPSVYRSSWSPSPTGTMLARHHPSARSSRPSGGAAYGVTNAADPLRSSMGGGCPQQTSSVQEPASATATVPPSADPAAGNGPSGAGKLASSAVTN